MTKHRLNIILQKLTGKKLLKRNYKTVIIDLTLPRDEILAKADKHSVVKNIERSKRRGVLIRDVTNDANAVFDYAKILHQSRVKLGIESRTLIQLHHEIVRLVADKDYTIFIAYWNDIPVGALGCKISGKRITEQGLARTELNDEQRLYCVDRLRWHLIFYGKEKGCTEYDLGGISDTTVKEISISRNKLKWNGNIMTLSRYA